MKDVRICASTVGLLQNTFKDKLKVGGEQMNVEQARLEAKDKKKIEEDSNYREIRHEANASGSRQGFKRPTPELDNTSSKRSCLGGDGTITFDTLNMNAGEQLEGDDITGIVISEILAHSPLRYVASVFSAGLAAIYPPSNTTGVVAPKITGVVGAAEPVVSVSVVPVSSTDNENAPAAASSNAVLPSTVGADAIFPVIETVVQQTLDISVVENPVNKQGKKTSNDAVIGDEPVVKKAKTPVTSSSTSNAVLPAAVQASVPVIDAVPAAAAPSNKISATKKAKKVTENPIVVVNKPTPSESCAGECTKVLGDGKPVKFEAIELLLAPVKKANAAVLNRLETSIVEHHTRERGKLLTVSATVCGDAPPLIITVLPKETNGINFWELEIPQSTYFVQKTGGSTGHGTAYTHRVENLILDIEAFLRNMVCQRETRGLYAREYLAYDISCRKSTWEVKALKECLMSPKLGFVDNDTRFKELIVKPLSVELKRKVKRIIETGSQ